MKTIITILFAAIFFGCVTKTPEGSFITNKTEIGDNFKIVEIDSCEYVFFRDDFYGSSGSITHKGNCKYCKKLNQ